jgi:hypothetical protein
MGWPFNFRNALSSVLPAIKDNVATGVTSTTGDNSNLSSDQGGVNTGIAGANAGNDLNAYPDQAPLPTYDIGNTYQTGENLSGTVTLPEVVQPTGGYNPEGGYTASTLLDQYKQNATYNIGQTNAKDGTVTGTGFTVPKIGKPGYETTTPALRDPSLIREEQGLTPGYTQDQYGRFNSLSSMYNDQLAMMTGSRGVRDEELATLMSGQDLPTYGPALPGLSARGNLYKPPATTDGTTTDGTTETPVETIVPPRTELDAAMELSAFYNSLPEYQRQQYSPSESRELLNRLMQGEALEDLITPMEYTPLSETNIDPALAEGITNFIQGGSEDLGKTYQTIYAKGGEVSLPEFLKNKRYGV